MIINPVLVNNSFAAKIAWEFSRPSEKGISKIDDIIKLDLPVNEFSILHLEFESTIIEREIITSTRNHHMWAQSSRIQNIREFEVADECKDFTQFYEDIRNNISDSMLRKERQDDYRLKLPIVALTKYSINITARDLVKLRLYFSYLSETIENETIALIFKNSTNKIQHTLDICGYSKKLTDNYRLDKILCEDFNVVSGMTSNNNAGFVTIAAWIPFHLRTHLVRHRNIFIRDNFFDLLNTNDSHLLDHNTQIACAFCGDNAAMAAITSRRSCWLAQYNIWRVLLNKIDNYIDTALILPCKDGKCPFEKDNMLRYTGKDPNPPCPIHIKLSNLSVTEDMIIEIEKQVKLDERPRFWLEKIKELEHTQ